MIKKTQHLSKSYLTKTKSQRVIKPTPNIISKGINQLKVEKYFYKVIKYVCVWIKIKNYG